MKDAIRNSIKINMRAYYDYQDERIALDGRLGIKKDGEAKAGAPETDETMMLVLRERRQSIFAFEEALFKDLAKEVHTHPLWIAFLADAKGVGESVAAVLISEIDIERATTVSKIWQFAGLNPGEVFGKLAKGKGKERKLIPTTDKIRGDKRTKGYLCPYNQFLKAKLCGVLGPSFLKCNSPYREYYDNMKHRLESAEWGTASKNPTDKARPKAGHQHKAATRYMVKMFLRDLYVAWRTLEGLPVREPYQSEYLGKRHSA